MGPFARTSRASRPERVRPRVVGRRSAPYHPVPRTHLSPDRAARPRLPAAARTGAPSGALPPDGRPVAALRRARSRDRLGGMVARDGRRGPSRGRSAGAVHVRGGPPCPRPARASRSRGARRDARSAARRLVRSNAERRVSLGGAASDRARRRRLHRPVGGPRRRLVHRRIAEWLSAAAPGFAPYGRPNSVGATKQELTRTAAAIPEDPLRWGQTRR